MALGSSRLRLQQVVPDVGAREIEIAANPFQNLRPQHEIVANAIVRCLDLLKGLDPVSTGERHENQQSTESGDQHQPAIHRWYEAGPRRRHCLYFTVSRRDPVKKYGFKSIVRVRAPPTKVRRSRVAAWAAKMVDRSPSRPIGRHSTPNAPNSRAGATNWRSTGRRKSKWQREDVNFGSWPARLSTNRQERWHPAPKRCHPLQGVKSRPFPRCRRGAGGCPTDRALKQRTARRYRNSSGTRSPRPNRADSSAVWTSMPQHSHAVSPYVTPVLGYDQNGYRGYTRNRVI